jgi:hypothetical protein
MARKRKRKEVQTTEWYEIEVKGWEVSYHFSLNTAPNLIEGEMWESSQLILNGILLSPVISSAKTRPDKIRKIKIEVAANPKIDDYWQEKPTIVSARGVGWMTLLKGDDTLVFHCMVPSRSLAFIAVAAQSGKIRHVSISGSKLKWRQGTISSFTFVTNKEEE